MLDTKLQMVVVSGDWKFKDFKSGQTGGMAIANLINPIPVLESWAQSTQSRLANTALVNLVVPSANEEMVASRIRDLSVQCLTGEPIEFEIEDTVGNAHKYMARFFSNESQAAKFTSPGRGGGGRSDAAIQQNIELAAKIEQIAGASAKTEQKLSELAEAQTKAAELQQSLQSDIRESVRIGNQLAAGQIAAGDRPTDSAGARAATRLEKVVAHAIRGRAAS